MNFLNGPSVNNKKIIRIAVSYEAGRWMFKNNSFKIINNGLNLDKYLFSEENRIRIRKLYGINNERVFINVGAFRFQKNHKFILEVFSIINSKIPSKLI